MGHYVLGHVRNSLLLLTLLLLVLLFAGYHVAALADPSRGGKWHIRGIADWASLPALLLIAAVVRVPHRAAR